MGGEGLVEQLEDALERKVRSSVEDLEPERPPYESSQAKHVAALVRDGGEARAGPEHEGGWPGDA